MSCSLFNDNAGVHARDKREDTLCCRTLPNRIAACMLHTHHKHPCGSQPKKTVPLPKLLSSCTFQRPQTLRQHAHTAHADSGTLGP